MPTEKDGVGLHAPGLWRFLGHAVQALFAEHELKYLSYPLPVAMCDRSPCARSSLGCCGCPCWVRKVPSVHGRIGLVPAGSEGGNHPGMILYLVDALVWGLCPDLPENELVLTERGVKEEREWD